MVTRNLTKTRKKKTRVRTKSDADLLNMYGAQPEYKGPGPKQDPEYRLKLGHALNWCSRGVEPTNGKKELLFWLKQNGYEQTKAIKAINENELITMGKLAFLANNGWPLDSNSIEYIDSNVKKLKDRGNTLLSEQAVESAENAKLEKLREENKTSAATQNAIEAQTVSETIEQVVWNREFPDSDVRKTIEGATAVVLNKAARRLKEVVEELRLIGEDEQVTEAYTLTKKQVAQNISNLNKAIDLMGQEKLNKKAIRKPRVKKPKSAAQQLVKFKFLNKDSSLGVISVDPVTIIGATKLVIFNVKTRKIGVYYAKDELGFSVKGTTLQNFDTNKSKQKTVRDTKAMKMADVVRKFRAAAITKCDKMFNELTTTETTLNGRFNNDILLLKVYK